MSLGTQIEAIMQPGRGAIDESCPAVTGAREALPNLLVTDTRKMKKKRSIELQHEE